MNLLKSSLRDFIQKGHEVFQNSKGLFYNKRQVEFHFLFKDFTISRPKSKWMHNFSAQWMKEISTKPNKFWNRVELISTTKTFENNNHSSYLHLIISLYFIPNYFWNLIPILNLTPLIAASIQGYSESVQLLLSQPNIEINKSENIWIQKSFIEFKFNYFIIFD